MRSLVLLTAAFVLGSLGLEARIKLVEFKNESNRAFCKNLADGRPLPRATSWGKPLPLLIDTPGAVIQSSDHRYQIIFEDAGHSGYHRPHWKFHVWLRCKGGLSFFNQERILYAVIFYDGDGEVKVHIDSQGKLHIRGGYDVKDILYPWAVGTIGRGNPYNKVKGRESDSSLNLGRKIRGVLTR